MKEKFNFMNRVVFMGILVFLYSIALSQDKIDYKDLDKIDEVFYLKGTNKPYTGMCYTMHPNGQLGMGGNLVNGLRDGEWFWYYDTGIPKRYASYKKGIKQGPTIFYYKNGQKKSEIIFDNDQNIRQSSWDETGKRVKNPSFEEFK